jgi:phosphohistidine phosphatase
MRTLTLLRHAHAEKHSHDGSDFARRLDARGELEAAEMAERATADGWIPDLIVISPAARTTQTAAAFLNRLGLSPQQARFDETIYLADRPTLTDLVRQLPDSARHVMLVGHNPGFSKLLRWLTNDDRADELVPATIVTLETDLKPWDDVSRGAFWEIRRLQPRRRFDESERTGVA